MLSFARLAAAPLALGVALAASGALPARAGADDAPAPVPSLELALFPVLTMQQIEGPNRDDLITLGAGLATMLAADVRLWGWFEPGVTVQLDVGSSRRASYERPGADGVAAEAAVVEGTYWELWLTLMLRARLGEHVFVELGWAPLILRDDAARGDLPNTRGETDGVFVGSRSVAWTLGVGARVPLAADLDLTLRLQGRIRYLVARGGEPLADDEETGQILLWPYIGLRYAL
ncbi:MAG: hypothetical protein KC635_28970 [Myxococcales bacterium]|nr:hypothetical protein [Myxococcales bacterium]MCB9734172.1 hypothetical protein [Deltaproteobacteria bacterium]